MRTKALFRSGEATPDALHYAFEYRDRGWPVVPVDGKTPATPWSAYQKEKPSVGQLREWFGSEHRYNVAIVTGSYSGLVVVDCDTVEDARWWQTCFPQTPLAVNTGGGGNHFYYRYPADIHVGNRTRVFGRQIDIRGEGGLAIAPPSVHQQTKQAYQWKKWSHYALDEVPLFDSRWTAQPEQSVSLSRPDARRSVPLIRDGVAYIQSIEAVAGNGGHNATFRAACKLRDSGLTAAEAFQALLQWNETNATPPWTAKELAHKVEDAYRGV